MTKRKARRILVGKRPIHSSVKKTLGYDPAISDKTFLSDWKKRSAHVCKPCWELKYCPYGPFVEQSPVLPSLREAAVEHNNYLLKCLETDLVGEQGPLDDMARASYEALLSMSEDDPVAFARFVAQGLDYEPMFTEVASAEELMGDLFNVENLLPIQEYRVPIPFEEEPKTFEITPEIQSAVERRLTEIREVLHTGMRDTRRPLDDVRRAWFEKQVVDFNPDDYPEEIPNEITDMECNIIWPHLPSCFRWRKHIGDFRVATQRAIYSIPCEDACR